MHREDPLPASQSPLMVLAQVTPKIIGAPCGLGEEAPFVLRLRAAGGEEQDVLARAVIDASGTYQTPNPLGASGIPALGEQALGAYIFYGIPDILGTQRERYAGRRVLVVGSGHSAFNALLELVELAREYPSTRPLWAMRRSDLSRLFGGGERDALPARGALGQRMQALVERGQVRSVVAALTGDWEAAQRLELVLPETGVCSSGTGGSCAVPATQALAGQDELVAASARCCTPPAGQLLTVGTAYKQAE
jgi:hypothetical protein